MKALTDFTTLTFDCYGTLIDWESGLLHALQPWLASRLRTVHDEEVLAAFAEAESAAQARTPGKPYPDILGDVMRALAAQWRVSVSATEVQCFSRSVRHWPAFADSAPALAYLRNHYRLVVLSNVDRASFAYSEAKLGVHFDAVYTAQDIGSYKPDLRNFRYLLDRLAGEGIALHQVLHVAQSLFHDHVPAQRLGLASLWVNRRAGRMGQGATPSASVSPDAEVGSLAELVMLHRGESNSD